MQCEVVIGQDPNRPEVRLYADIGGKITVLLILFSLLRQWIGALLYFGEVNPDFFSSIHTILYSMNSLIQNLSLPLLLYTVVLQLAPFAEATPIYKSTDAEGNVTYSSKPPGDAVTIEKITLTPDYDVTPSADNTVNIEAIKQTADQLEKERKQREKERKEAQQQAEAESRQQSNTQPETVIQYYPVYPFYYYPGRPYPWRPHPPKPRPPHSHPPKPGPPHSRSPTTQPPPQKRIP